MHYYQEYACKHTVSLKKKPAIDICFVKDGQLTFVHILECDAPYMLISQ